MNEDTTVIEQATDQHLQPRKPRLALMGEFSAGKSTLSNMLLGEAPFPVKVTATRLPPVWASYGDPAAFAVDHDGNETPLDLNDLASVSLDDCALIRLQRPADILQLCDLIDMPGVSDPNMPADVWLSLVSEIDSVIWCTHANQAWRQSEAAIWERIVDETNGDNILLITQIDKIRNDRDRDRVISRVRKETDGLFPAVFPVSLLAAINAGDDFDPTSDADTTAFIEHLIELLLQPAGEAPRNAVQLDTVPELPGKETVADKRISVEPTIDAEPPAAAPDEVARESVMPRRVRPSVAAARPRPPRSETAHSLSAGVGHV